MLCSTIHDIVSPELVHVCEGERPHAACPWMRRTSQPPGWTAPRMVL